MEQDFSEETALNLSFLESGVYFVWVNREAFRVIKF
jgi:hypothetical protein